MVSKIKIETIKNLAKNIGLPILIILGVIIIGGFVYFVRYKNNEISSNPTIYPAAPGSTTVTQNSQTYTDTRYGFAITYPADARPVNTIDGIYQIRLNVPSVQVGAGNVPAVVNIYVKSAGVSCLAAPFSYGGSVTNKGMTTINGVQFKSYIREVGLGQIKRTSTTYAVVHNNLCYILEASLVTSDSFQYFGAQMTPEQAKAEFTSLNASIKSILQSFRFNNKK